jgi:hypothetical protein
MKKLLLGAAAVLALGFSTTALAATDGTLSATSSTGTFLVNTTLPKLVRISGLSDVTHVFTATEIAAAAAIASYSPVTLPGNNFCVYSNDGTDGAYTLTVSGPTGPAGGNENFGLVGGTSGGRIPMRVIVSDNPTNEFQDTALTGGNPSPLVTWRSQDSVCRGVVARVRAPSPASRFRLSPTSAVGALLFRSSGDGGVAHGGRCHRRAPGLQPNAHAMAAPRFVVPHGLDPPRRKHPRRPVGPWRGGSTVKFDHERPQASN